MIETKLPKSDRELVISRYIPTSPDRVYRAWTEPSLIVKWFTPPPYLTTQAVLDVRPGGSNFIMMQSPDGVDIPNRGVYLEVMENERLVITDAFTSAWEPAEKPFVTICLSFEVEAEGTRYTARVKHGSIEDRERHEAMGFYEGWGIATDQLAALAITL